MGCGDEILPRRRYAIEPLIARKERVEAQGKFLEPLAGLRAHENGLGVLGPEARPGKLIELVRLIKEDQRGFLSRPDLA